MRAIKIDRVVLVGALLSGLANLIPVCSSFAGFAVAFGARDSSSNTFISVTFFGGIILWFLVPIAAGFLVTRTAARNALRSGERINSQSPVVSGMIATALAQLPLMLCALWFFGVSLPQTRDMRGTFLVLVFALVVPIISALLGGLGGVIYRGNQTANAALSEQNNVRL